MAIKLPLTTVMDANDTGSVGATSVAGGVPKTFMLPQDTDGVVVKLTASLVGAAVSATLQTTDDGGTTWYDVGRTSLVSLANNTTAAWLAAATFGTGMRTTISGSSSTAGGTTPVSVMGATNSAAASSLGHSQVSGLPILSQQARIFIIYSGNITSNDLTRVVVYANNQSASAR